MDYIEVGANLATITTAVVACVAFGGFKMQAYRRRRAIEDYLREDRKTSACEGRRTVLHLMATLKLTESQVFEAAFSSKEIIPVRIVDRAVGEVVEIQFQHRGPIY